MYYIYILRCKDDSLYSGIAPDIAKRMKVHFEGGKSSSKYVRAKGAAKLEMFWECDDKSEASKLEYRLKRLTKEKKESLIAGESMLEDLFSEKLDCGLYRPRGTENIELEEYMRGR
ncbi:MAG: GIY-YIG nuclease family protein [Firmicutes bacterium]|nr:GIY-YIG nuclease family protein [Bacillota bacterium]